MNGRTHLVGGLLAGAVIAPAFSLGHAAVPMIAASVIAGPLADIDHPGSMYGRWLPFPGVQVVNGHMERWDLYHQRGRVGRSFFGSVLWHRGPTHSLLASVICALVAYSLVLGLIPHLAVPVALGVLVGYLSHLALDLMNVMPIGLLWPFSPRPVAMRFLKIRVGSMPETAIFLFMLVGCYFALRGMF